MNGRAKSISLWASLPLSQEKAKESVGQGGNGRANSPPPACPHSLCLLHTGRETIRSHSPLLILLFLESTEVQQKLVFKQKKMACGTLRSLSTLMGGCSTKKMSLWFGGTCPIGLWCANKHRIMAARIPTPQSVTVGTEGHHFLAKPFEALPKSNCLAENPFTVCTSFSERCPLYYTQASRLVDMCAQIPLQHTAMPSCWSKSHATNRDGSKAFKLRFIK